MHRKMKPSSKLWIVAFFDSSPVLARHCSAAIADDHNPTRNPYHNNNVAFEVLHSIAVAILTCRLQRKSRHHWKEVF
jgi:hypothetical protein